MSAKDYFRKGKEADVSNPKNVSELKLDNSQWQYDKDNDVYYQIGISYCADPAEKKYEKLSVYVPGKYMTAKKNSDGTFTAALSDDLAEAYAEYINKAGFKSGDETLKLEKTKK